MSSIATRENRWSPQQFTFKHIDDATTTRLAIAEKNGTVIEWGYLNVCKPTGGQQVVTSTMIFRGIKIVKVKVTQEEISEGIVEFVDTVKIYADKFTWSVDGAVTRTVTIGDAADPGRGHCGAWDGREEECGGYELRAWLLLYALRRGRSPRPTDDGDGVRVGSLRYGQGRGVFRSGEAVRRGGLFHDQREGYSRYSTRLRLRRLRY